MKLEVETMGHGATYLQDMALGKKILDIVEKHYAYYDWLVDCNHEAGIASIQLMYHGPNMEIKVWKYGFLMHINKLASLTEHELEGKVKKSAGEVLERYKMARKAATENDLVDFMSNGIVDTAGMVMESRKN
jgi:hypothetical protein